MSHGESHSEGSEARTESWPHHHVPFMKIFFALLILTAVTVGIGIYLRFDNELVNVLLALLIAATKASLVAMFFMHLKFESKLIVAIFVVPLALCVLLVVALLPDLLQIGDGMKLFNTPQVSLHQAPPAK